MAQLDTTNTFVDGDVVNAAVLNNIVDQATALSGIITDQPPVGTALDPALDQVLVNDASAAGPNRLRRATVSQLPSGVTSVGLTATPASVFGAPGGPITTSGTFSISLDTQGPNQFLAGPVSGAPTTPAFRALVPADTAISSVLIAAAAIDWNLSNLFHKVMAGNIVFSFANANDGQVIRVRLQQGASWTASWPGTVLWRGGAQPVLTVGVGRKDVYTFLNIAGVIYGYSDKDFS